MTTTKLPNSAMCFVCGLENETGLQMTFYAIDENNIEAHFTIPARFQSYPGMAHGGIVASMLDEMITRVFMAKDPNRFMFTGRLTTRLRKHTPIEQPLRLTGTIVKDRGRVGEAAAALYGPDGELLAEADGLAVAVTPDEFDINSLDELGWKVYPD
jgi:acyl-coenzyme A thioesterase PaaI-like protein